MSSAQCWPDAVENPNATEDQKSSDPNNKELPDQCIMPLRYWEPGYTSSTMYSWLTYQPKSVTGSNPDLFSSAYGDVFKTNLPVGDPDTTNQNRLNLYQPTAANPLHKGLQWVSAVYPNASGMTASSDCVAGRGCPGLSNFICNSNVCDPGCSYWAHEYNLENVYLTQDPHDSTNLLPKHPPRKALYGIVAENPNNTEAQPGMPVKYGDVFYLYVSLLDLDPDVEKQAVQTKGKSKKNFLSPTYQAMPLLVTKDPRAAKPYIILGQQSGSTGSTFSQLATGDRAQFQIKSLNAAKSDGSDGTPADVVMSGDQFYLEDKQTGNRVKWETLNFSQAWHGNNNQALIPSGGGSSNAGGHHSSWMFSNRYYWQANVFGEGQLQLRGNPNQTYRQWNSNSTQGVDTNCRAVTPTGSILLLGTTDDVPALHWFLDARYGQPQMENKHTICSSENTSCPGGQVCDTAVGMCKKPPAHQKDAHKFIMYAFLGIGAFVLVGLLFAAYKVYSQHKLLQTQQIRESQTEMAAQTIAG